jgi:hypothetical protein
MLRLSSMSKFRRIALVTSVVVIVGVLAVFVANRYIASHVFEVDSGEMAALAKEHIQCAGLYAVFKRSLHKESPDFLERDREYTFELKQHSTMAFNFSPDKSKLESQIFSAADEFGQEILSAADKDKVSALVDSKTNACYGLVLRSSDFVNRTLKERIRKLKAIPWPISLLPISNP